MGRLLCCFVFVMGVVMGQGSSVPQFGPGHSAFQLKPLPHETGLLPRTIPPNLPACQHSNCACYWLVVLEATDWQSKYGSTQSNLPGTVFALDENGNATDREFMEAVARAHSSEGDVGMVGVAKLSPQSCSPRQRLQALRAQSECESALFFGVYHKAGCPDCSGANGTPRCYIQCESRPSVIGTATKVGRALYEYEFLMLTKFTSCTGADNLLHVIEKEDFDGVRVSTASVTMPLPLNFMGQATQNAMPVNLGLSAPTNRYYSSMMRFEGKHVMMEEVLMFGQIEGRLEAEPTSSAEQENRSSIHVRDSSHNMRLSFLCPCDNANHADPPDDFADGVAPSGTTGGFPGAPDGTTPGTPGKKTRRIGKVGHGGGMLLGGMECLGCDPRPLPLPGYRLR